METGKKSNVGLIVGLVVLALVAIGAFSAALFLSKDKNSSADNGNTTNKNETAEKEGKNESAKKEETKTSTIEFKGYTFTVPSDVTASVTGEQLFVYGPGSKWVGVVMMQTAKYDTLVSMKDQIKVALSAQEQAKDYDLTNAVTEEKEYGGKSFLVTSNIASQNYDLDISYGKADDENVYVVSLTKSDGTKLTEDERTEMYGLTATGQKTA